MKSPELTPDGKHLKRLLEFCEDLRRVNESQHVRDDGWDDEAWELSCRLDRFLIGLFDPHNVADIRMMPEPLRADAVLSLIERDAVDAYDQIDGFCDLVIMEDLTSQILENCQPTDGGLQICQWITDNIPEAETEECCGI